MKRIWLFIFVCMLATTPLSSAQQRYDADGAEIIADADDIIATFSIVARDPVTGELGVAVQSRAFRAGAIVSYARAGVGAVATQAAANQTYGPEGLKLLEQGLSPDQVVEQLTSSDPGRSRRQLAVIDAEGRVRAYTGEDCSDWAGHIEGDNYSAQGNILAGEAVVREMARAFESAEGQLAERLMVALEAGQAAGGDARGMQSGGILVVKPIDDPSRTTDRWVDIRVDDSPDPFAELRRLLDISMAGNHSRMSRQLAGEGKFAEAIEAQKDAIALKPDDDQYIYGLARLYARSGDAANAVESLGQAIAKFPGWRELAARHPDFERIREDSGFKRLIQP